MVVHVRERGTPKYLKFKKVRFFFVVKPRHVPNWIVFKEQIRFCQRETWRREPRKYIQQTTVVDE